MPSTIASKRLHGFLFGMADRKEKSLSLNAVIGYACDITFCIARVDSVLGTIIIEGIKGFAQCNGLDFAVLRYSKELALTSCCHIKVTGFIACQTGN
ncbi:MAG: hypothetical protein BWY75_02786 [bacterium ADurb.Bin425]|nr:MAG: hypothetical protein BWY75_02786 [bacterium ADurb.Bin425]